MPLTCLCSQNQILSFNYPEQPLSLMTGVAALLTLIRAEGLFFVVLGQKGGKQENGRDG